MPSLDLQKANDWSGFSRTGFSNRVRVKVDTSTVGEDLTDFPLYLPFSSGDASSAILSHFSLAAATYTFTGTDGDLPDQRYWIADAGPKMNMFIKSNVLAMDCPALPVTGGIVCFLRYVFDGDFDIELGIQNFSETNDCRMEIDFSEEVQISNQFGYVGYVGMYRTVAGAKVWDSDYSTQAWGASGGYVSTSRTNSYGRLRFIRAGSTITCQYKDGGGAWVTLRNVPATSRRMRFYFYCNNNSTSASYVEVTDFKINSTSGNAPRTQNLKNGHNFHMLVTDGRDNPLPVQMGVWKSTQGGLFVKVPKLYSAVPTELRIYYDRNKVPTYVNAPNFTSTVLPSVNVWDSYFAGVYIFADLAGTTVDSCYAAGNSSNQTIAEKGTISSLFASYGALYNASTHITNIYSNQALNTLSSFTLEVIYTPITQQAQGIYGMLAAKCMMSDADPWELFSIFLDGDTGYPHKVFGKVSTGVAGSALTVRSTTALTQNVTYYITVTYDLASADLKIYINGAWEATAHASRTMPKNGNPLCFGRHYAGTAKTAEGVISLVRISNIARSAGWIAAAYKAFTGTLFTYATAETY